MAKKAAKKKAKKAAKKSGKKTVRRSAKKATKKRVKQASSSAARRTPKPAKAAKKNKKPKKSKTKQSAQASAAWSKNLQELLALPQRTGELWQLESVPFDETHQAVVIFEHSCGPDCEEDHAHDAEHQPAQDDDSFVAEGADGEEEPFELSEVDLTWRLVVADGASGQPLHVSGGSEPATLDEAWEGLLAAMRSPRAGSPRRPAKLQVAADDLQSRWGKTLKQLGIELEAVADLQSVAEGFHRSLHPEEKNA